MDVASAAIDVASPTMKSASVTMNVSIALQSSLNVASPATSNENLNCQCCNQHTPSAVQYRSVRDTSAILRYNDSKEML
jgi:hypothetical protein